MRKPAALKKGDVIIIAVLLLASLSWLAASVCRNNRNTHELSVEIYQDGQLLQTLALTDSEQILRLESAAGYNVLQIGPQGARILEADCHNQDCVHTGLQNQPGSIIACLPHRLLVCINGGKEAEFDAITR